MQVNRVNMYVCICVCMNDSQTFGFPARHTVITTWIRHVIDLSLTDCMTALIPTGFFFFLTNLDV